MARTTGWAARVLLFGWLAAVHDAMPPSDAELDAPGAPGVVLARVRGLERSGTNLLQNLLNLCALTYSEGHCHDPEPFLQLFKQRYPRHTDDEADHGPRHRHHVHRLEPLEALVVGRGHPVREHKRARRLSGYQGSPCWKHFRVQADSLPAGMLGNDATAPLAGMVSNLSSLDALTDTRPPMTHVVVVKGPVAWVTSFCTWHLRCNVTDEIVLGALTREWNGYVSKWFEMQDQHPARVVLASYEQILIDGRIGLAPVVDALEAHGRTEGAACVAREGANLHATGTLDGRHEPHVMMSHHEHWNTRKKHYLQCEYLAALNRHQVEAITAAVDKRLVGRLGLRLAALPTPNARLPGACLLPRIAPDRHQARRRDTQKHRPLPSILARVEKET